MWLHLMPRDAPPAVPVEDPRPARPPDEPVEEPRPDRNIADALLALRLFADSLEPNTTVYQGLAAIDLDQAFRIVAWDAEKKENAARAEDKSQIKPLTRFRLTSAIADGLAQRIVPFGAASWDQSAKSLS
ncbi:MAG: hypothetical protein QOJ19_4212, partial [Acidimicrobiia bacterium]|nr:hypothetical protein [Acidimicrobiia bacterium]